MTSKDSPTPGPDPLGPVTASAPAPDPAPVIDQAFDTGSLYALREAMAAHAAAAGLPEGRVTDAVLAVHELAANAVRHGAGHGRLRVWRTGDVLRCEVTDGDGASARGGESGPAAPAVWPVEHGHGLWLIRQVADQASLDCGPLGTVATVSFTLGPPGPLVPFGLGRRTQDGCAIVTVTGELDLGSAGRLTAMIADLMTMAPEATGGGLRLVLDLAGITGWDSAGLAALLTAQGWTDADPAADMILAGLPAHLAERLRGAGLASRFTMARAARDALDTFAPPALPPGVRWLC
jgi:anti-sigma regulatory factor (Ser/Thr protein kinase)/anti-anti-sigma regulatory factor